MKLYVHTKSSCVFSLRDDFRRKIRAKISFAINGFLTIGIKCSLVEI